MVEIDEVGQVVDTRPMKGAVVTETRADGFENGTRRPQLRVAVHAGFRRRNPCEWRCLYRRMAIPAVDAIVANVMGVAELQGLFDEFLRAGRVAGPLERHCQPEEQADKDDEAEETNSRKGIGAAFEYLRHS